MRHADTETLLRLNDEAKLADLNRWVKVRFFDDVADDGLHILYLAIPHGVRPRTDAPLRRTFEPFGCAR